MSQTIGWLLLSIIDRQNHDLAGRTQFRHDGNLSTLSIFAEHHILPFFGIVVLLPLDDSARKQDQFYIKPRHVIIVHLFVGMNRYDILLCRICARMRVRLRSNTQSSP